MVAAEISISPVDCPSMLYSSVTAEPAPTIDQPFVVLKARSLTWGECPEPYPEPPDPIWVEKSFVVPLALGLLAVTQIFPVSVKEEESSI
jgi:hypothetical protein